jgi:hypothetical protein
MSWYSNPVGTLSGFLGGQVAQDPGGASTLNTEDQQNQNYQAHQMAQARQLAAQRQATFQGQNGLATTLNNTITNPNAPSVALSQLGQGFNQIAGQQLAGAAGASGENAMAARRVAAQNIAGAQAGLNAQQAGVRAGEVAAAQTGLSNLYTSQLGAENAGQQNSLSSANSYATTNEAGQAAIENANAQAKQANAKANSGLLGGIGSALAAL